jgi:hypothetical protein
MNNNFIDQVSVAYIGKLSQEVFNVLKEQKLIPEHIKNPAQELDEFFRTFSHAYNNPNPSEPAIIPPYRQFVRYGNGGFLHPFASQEAFPESQGFRAIKKKMLGQTLRNAAAECCDVLVDSGGHIITAATEIPIVVIHRTERSITYQIISAAKEDAEYVKSPQTSPNGVNLLELMLQSPETLIPFFIELRNKGGEAVRQMLIRPPYCLSRQP